MFQANYTSLPFSGAVCPKDKLEELNLIEQGIIDIGVPSWYNDPMPFDNALYQNLLFYSHCAHLLGVDTFAQLQECNSEDQEVSWTDESARLGESGWMESTQIGEEEIGVDDLFFYYKEFEGKRYVDYGYIGVFSYLTTL